MRVETGECGASGAAWTPLLAEAQKAMSQGSEVRVSPKQIQPMPGQPRKFFNEEALERLADSMVTIGQLVPGIIRSIPAQGEVQYELLDGERRWRAAARRNLPYRATLVDVEC